MDMYETKQKIGLPSRTITTKRINRCYCNSKQNKDLTQRSVVQFKPIVVIDGTTIVGLGQIKFYLAKRFQEFGFKIQSYNNYDQIYVFICEHNSNVNFNQILDYAKTNEIIVPIHSYSKKGKIVNPHTRSGPKELNVFSSDTKKKVLIDNGQHRRHIIPRSILWQAVQKAELNSRDHTPVLKFLAACNIDPHNMSSHNLYETSYRILQDQPGNLWAGAGGENSAIGFFPTFLLNEINSIITSNIEEGIDISCDIDAQLVIKSIMEINSPMHFLEKHFNYLKEMFVLLIQNESVENCISVNALLDLVDDFVINCEFDPSPFLGDVNMCFLDLMNRMSHSQNIFRDKIANEFMFLTGNSFTVPQLETEEEDDVEFIPTEQQSEILSQFIIEPIAANGHCFLDAVSSVLGIDIRECFLQNFFNCPILDQLMQFGIDPHVIHDVVINNNFGNPLYDLIPEIVAMMFKIRLHILQPNGRFITLDCGDGAQTEIYLIRYEQPICHYNVLMLMVDNEKE